MQCGATIDKTKTLVLNFSRLKGHFNCINFKRLLMKRERDLGTATKVTGLF